MLVRARFCGLRPLRARNYISCKSMHMFDAVLIRTQPLVLVASEGFCKSLVIHIYVKAWTTLPKYMLLWRLASSGTLRRAALVRTDVSDQLSASIIRVTRIVELGTKLTLFLVHRFLLPWWRRYVRPKCRFLQEPHGVTSQKTQFFIVTAAKASNLTHVSLFLYQSWDLNITLLRLVAPSTSEFLVYFSVYVQLRCLPQSFLFIENMYPTWRMPSSEMSRLVAVVKFYVSEERIISIIRVTRISGLGRTSAVTSNSPKTFILTRATRCHILVDGIIHSYHHENLISYINTTCFGLFGHSQINKFALQGGPWQATATAVGFFSGLALKFSWSNLSVAFIRPSL
jgi:hypothetical protein